MNQSLTCPPIFQQKTWLLQTPASGAEKFGVTRSLKAIFRLVVARA